MTVGLVIWGDGYRPRWRPALDLTAPLGMAGPPLAIFKGRFAGIPGIEGPVVLVPDRPEEAGLLEQALGLGLEVETYPWAEVQPLPWWMCPERWGMEDDAGLGSWAGGPLAELTRRRKWKQLIIVPLTNLLVDRAGIEASLALHRREGFNVTLSFDRVLGANWSVFEAELLQGLQASHPDLMATAGGLTWILRKPLYTFPIGEFHAPRDRPRLPADLRLVSRRTWTTLERSQGSDFARREFDYVTWLHRSGWETHWCDQGPRRVVIEPTNRCDARCVGCPQPVMQRPRGDMPAPAFWQYVDGLGPDFDGRFVLSGMGEPLANPGVAEMVEALRGRPTLLCTSLSVSPPDSFPWTALTQVRLSVDAVERQGFEAVRPGCDWVAMEKFIAWASERKVAAPDEFPDLGFSFVKHQRNGGAARAFLQYWQKVGTPVFKEHFFRWPLTNPPDRAQWAQILGFSDYLGQIPWLGETRFCPVKRRPCLHALQGLHVLWDGTVTACPFDYEGKWPLGTLREQTAAEVWAGERAREFRRRHLALDFPEEWPCGPCQDWYHRA